jgi:hypothetical protein
MEKIKEVNRNKGIYKGGGKLMPIYTYIKLCLFIRLFPRVLQCV